VKFGGASRNVHASDFCQLPIHHSPSNAPLSNAELGGPSLSNILLSTSNSNVFGYI
jgi:hypothetical protein